MTDALLFDLSDFQDADAIAAGLKKEIRHKEKTRAVEPRNLRPRRKSHELRSVAGMSIVTPAFFAAWGWWNLAYYPHLGQMWSAAAAISTALLNSIYVGYVVKTRHCMEETA